MCCRPPQQSHPQMPLICSLGTLHKLKRDKTYQIMWIHFYGFDVPALVVFITSNATLSQQVHAMVSEQLHCPLKLSGPMMACSAIFGMCRQIMMPSRRPSDCQFLFWFAVTYFMVLINRQTNSANW